MPSRACENFLIQLHLHQGVEQVVLLLADVHAVKDAENLILAHPVAGAQFAERRGALGVLGRADGHHIGGSETSPDAHHLGGVQGRRAGQDQRTPLRRRPNGGNVLLLALENAEGTANVAGHRKGMLVLDGAGKYLRLEALAFILREDILELSLEVLFLLELLVFQLLELEQHAFGDAVGAKGIEHRVRDPVVRQQFHAQRRRQRDRLFFLGGGQPRYLQAQGQHREHQDHATQQHPQHENAGNPENPTLPATPGGQGLRRDLLLGARLRRRLTVGRGRKEGVVGEGRRFHDVLGPAVAQVGNSSAKGSSRGGKEL